MIPDELSILCDAAEDLGFETLALRSKADALVTAASLVFSPPPDLVVRRGDGVPYLSRRRIHYGIDLRTGNGDGQYKSGSGRGSGDTDWFLRGGGQGDSGEIGFSESETTE